MGFNMLTLNWFCRDSANRDYRLSDVLLSDSHFTDLEGVYIIWYAQGIIPVSVYIGQGIIKNRLYAHRNDPRILKYNSPTTPLYVAWAKVAWIHRTGVEMYLHNELSPLVGEPPQGNPIPVPVNLPS